MYILSNVALVDWRETGSDDGAKSLNQSQDAVLEQHCASVFVQFRMAWDAKTGINQRLWTQPHSFSTCR